MSKNSRNINYTLRVAKSVERKMFCSAFQKLSVFHPLEDYQYIGFGALYFADFYLIHKTLGINKMTSIEKSQQRSTKARYNFNKPFKCIDIQFDSAKMILPQIDWSIPSIVWLDYTSELNSDVLYDIATVLRNAVPGSFLLVSISSDSERFDSDISGKKRLDILQEKVGKSRLLREFKENDINNKKLPIVYTKILRKEIDNILYERGVADSKASLKFNQLFNIKYQDGKPMYTFGGLITDGHEQETLYSNVKFDDLPFVKKGDEPFKIDVPNLTFKEVKFLESLMPDGIDATGKIIDIKSLHHKDPQIPEGDVLKFSNIYKYFPSFAETNLG